MKACLPFVWPKSGGAQLKKLLRGELKGRIISREHHAAFLLVSLKLAVIPDTFSLLQIVYLLRIVVVYIISSHYKI